MPQYIEEQEETVVDTPTSQTVRTTRAVTPSTPVVDGNPQQKYGTKKVIFRTYQVVWYILGVIEVLLAFRVLLKLLGANPVSGFTDFIYTLSAPFAVPFLGVIAPTATGTSIIEWSTFLAMLVYLIVAYGLVRLMQFIKPVEPEEVEQTVDTEV